MKGRHVSAVLILLACICFGMALVLPLFSVQPAAGRWTGVVRIFAGGEFQMQTFTLLGGIRLLWQNGELFLALILTVFSLIFPLFKLLVLWFDVIGPRGMPALLMKACRVAARYAMVEVFLLALLVLLLKGMPGGSEVSLQGGAYAFALSVLLGLAASAITLRQASTAISLPESKERIRQAET